MSQNDPIHKHYSLVVPDCAGHRWLADYFDDYLSRHMSDLCPVRHIHVDPPESEEELFARIAQADIILSFFRGARLEKDLLFRVRDRVRLISVAGPVGQSIDVAAASENGIPLHWTHQAATESVAEMTIALMLQVTRDLPWVSHSGRDPDGQGRMSVLPEHFWRTRFTEGLYRKKLGLIGLGEIGKRVAAIASAIGMEIYAWSPNMTEDKAAAAGCRYLDLPELVRAVDVLSLHIRLADSTEGIISRAHLESMKPGACLINTSRGRLVDEPALMDMLRQGRLRAGLDVFWKEPLLPGDPWFDVPNAVLTPHAAWHTVAAVDSFIARAVANIRTVLS